MSGDTFSLFDPADIRVLEFELGGRLHLFAAPIGDRDPMEVSLGEWQAWPELSALAMLDRLLADRDRKGGAA
ncbi:MAG TPA: hypothetical protein VFY63_08655 [Pseudorhizobium sp.]|nr:hypothetical protein [Pseudorhizobium sp.]